MSEKSHWIRTVGAPRPDDPRNGELHQVFGDLPSRFDLEPWDDSGDDYARYVRSDVPAEVDADGREVWIYEFVADGTQWA